MFMVRFVVFKAGMWEVSNRMQHEVGYQPFHESFKHFVGCLAKTDRSA